MSRTDHYDVFLSFRGLDTRQGFIDCLYNCMRDAGIRVFKDDDELSVGQPINEILGAIENSKICMPVFSQSFASSSWCLREVAKMVELKKEIVPIFYDVVPDDVKLRTSRYGNDMTKHKVKDGADRVVQWEAALKEVARIKGRELKEKGYYEFSKELAREILIKLKPNKKYVSNHLVGMDDSIEIVMKLLNTECGGVRCVGIHGMGGSGKTTLAKVLFNKLSVMFDTCCFLADIRESSIRDGEEHLEKDLLSKLFPNLKGITHIIDPIEMIEKFRKKVLIVLDDVDKKEQIEKIVGETNRFASGSRIIVTTRDVRVLQIGLRSIEEIFEVKGLTFSQGLQLFNHHAFNKDSPPHDFESLSEEVVRSCKGLPLALEVLGSLLHQKSKKIWSATIKKLEKVQDRAVQDKLKISYDALEHEQQQIFLDIACFVINNEKSYMAYMWEACGFHPALELDVLASMSLIKIVEDEKLWMHDHLRDLGKEIVREEGLKYPRKCSRLHGRCDEMAGTLNIKEGKEDIVGLRLEGPYPKYTGEVLAGLYNLRFLSLEDANFSKKFKYPLPQLNWLSWRKCPSSFSASHLHINKLAILELPDSSITEKWDGWSHIKMVHLKVLDLTNCRKLKRTPDFSKIPSLERLSLCRCTNLVELHVSIVKLTSLKYLDLSHCSSLLKLPEELGFLENLEQLSLHGCKSLKNLPDSIGKLKSLVSLDMSGKQNSLDKLTSLSNLMEGCLSSMDDDMDMSCLSKFVDHSIMGQTKYTAQLLKDIAVFWWENRFSGFGTQLPDIFSNLKVLTKLDLSYLWVHSIPDSIGNLDNLRELKAKRSSLFALPKSIGLLQKLEMLDMGGSFFLEEIPQEIGGLRSLRILNLCLTSIHRLPSTIIELSLLHSLSLTSCTDLGNPKDGLTSLANQLDEESPKQVQPTDDSEDFIALPTSFEDFSHLEILELCCQHLTCIPTLPFNLQRLVLDEFNYGVKLPDISNANNLTYLYIYFSKGHFEHENLTSLPESLRELRLVGAPVLSDLSNLKNLQKLVIQGSETLNKIPGLGKLETLEELHISQCKSLDSLENLSELRNLQYLSIILCPKFGAVEGLDTLHLVLRDVHFGNCKCKECRTNTKPSRRRQLLSWVNSTIVGIDPSDFPVQLQYYLERKGADEGHEREL